MESLQYILLSPWCSLPVGVISAVGTACTVSALPPIKIPIDSGYLSLCSFLFLLAFCFLYKHLIYFWMAEGLAWMGGSGCRLCRVLGSTNQIRLHLPINPRQFIQPLQSNHTRQKYIPKGYNSCNYIPSNVLSPPGQPLTKSRPPNNPVAIYTLDEIYTREPYSRSNDTSQIKNGV